MSDPTRDDEAAADTAEPYYHSVPKHPRVGTAILVSFLFLGGGQLVKGQARRFVGLWIFVLLSAAAIVGVTMLIRPSVDTYNLSMGALKLMYSLTWIYAIFDAAFRA